MTFIPFDATEDEVAQMSIIREGLPLVLAEPLKAWLASAVPQLYESVDHQFGLQLQLELDIDLGFTSQRSMHVANFAAAALQVGPETFLRVLDYVLFSLPWGQGKTAGQLSDYLDTYRSKYCVAERDGKHRISYRLPEGLEETMQESINASEATAGKLLAEAWAYAFGLDPKPEEAMDKAVKAVERVVTPIVCKNHGKPSLGVAIAYIRDQGNWSHGLRIDGQKAPANDTIYSMLQTLWAGQHYRHVDQNAIPPTIEQAQTHVQLAATMVGWFSSGSIRQQP